MRSLAAGALDGAARFAAGAGRHGVVEHGVVEHGVVEH